MSVMIERVARALEAELSDQLPDTPLAAVAKYLNTEAIARAAIEAMREPTEAMLGEGDEYAIDGSRIDRVWRAMIDAALNDLEGDAS